MLDIQNYFLDKGNARIDLVHQVVRTLYWPYVKNTYRTAWYGQVYLRANTWLDSSDQSFQGRPS